MPDTRTSSISRFGEPTSTPLDAVTAGAEGLRIPILQEEVTVETREQELERVRVVTSSSTAQVAVDATLERDEVEVRRVPVGREVTEAPAIREDGDLTIVPVLEERLIVEKRLFLVEEIHLVRRRVSKTVSIPAELRRTKVEIERSTSDHQREDN